MPSLARDMKQPEKFDRVVNWAFVSLAIISCPLSESVWSYSKTFFFFKKRKGFLTRGLTQAIATGISFTAGAAGYLMFGKTVSDEVGLSSSPHFSFFSKRFPQLMEYCKNT